MTDISGVLAGWEEARNNLGRKGTLKVVALRVAGQKVADALRLTDQENAALRGSIADVRFSEDEADRVADALGQVEYDLAACLEREKQWRRLAERAVSASWDSERVAIGKEIQALGVAQGAPRVATEDGKA